MPSIVMVRVGNPPPASHPIRPLMPDSGEYPRDFMNVKGFRGGEAPYGSVRSNASLKITIRRRHAKGRRVNVPIMFIALDMPVKATLLTPLWATDWSRIVR